MHKRTVDVDFTNVRSPTVPEVKRDSKGRWMKGYSGNPNGNKDAKGKRAKLSPETIALLTANTDEAIRTLIDLMDSPDPTIRLTAAKYFIDKNLGRDFQAFEPLGDDIDDMEIHIKVKRESEREDDIL